MTNQRFSEIDCTASGGCYGQNIAAGYAPTQMGFLISDGFYNSEEPLYRHYNTEPSLATVQAEIRAWGHFSQIVWLGSGSVGCYTNDCSAFANPATGSSGLGNIAVVTNIRPFFTVCNYYPPGKLSRLYSGGLPYTARYHIDCLFHLLYSVTTDFITQHHYTLTSASHSPLSYPSRMSNISTPITHQSLPQNHSPISTPHSHTPLQQPSHVSLELQVPKILIILSDRKLHRLLPLQRPRPPRPRLPQHPRKLPVSHRRQLRRHRHGARQRDHG